MATTGTALGPLLLAGCTGVRLFTLTGERVDPPPLAALRLLRDRSFAVYWLASLGLYVSISFNSQVTPQLEAVCLRCLRKDPWRRYSRVYDLIMRLKYFQDNPEGRDGPSRQGLRPKPPSPGDES